VRLRSQDGYMDIDAEFKVHIDFPRDASCATLGIQDVSLSRFDSLPQLFMILGRYVKDIVEIESIFADVVNCNKRDSRTLILGAFMRTVSDK